MNYRERFRVPPGTTIKLKDIDPAFKDRHHESHKEAADELEHYRQKLRELQEVLYADGRRSLLLCLQALDAGGKDGTISHILGGTDMHFQATELDVVHDDGLTHQVAARLHCRLGSQVRDLKIFTLPDGLIVHGRVNAYYGQQLAQHVVMEISGRSILANELAVF